MNKDAILASIIGFGIGLLITGAILIGPQILPLLKKVNKSGDVQSATTQVSPIVNVSPTKEPVTASIDAPSDETIAESTPLSVSGHAPSGTIVVVASPQEEQVVQAVGSNTFQTQVELKEGKNDISITYLSEGSNTVKHLTVYYTPKS